jgi:hypothetical protein
MEAVSSERVVKAILDMDKIDIESLNQAYAQLEKA